MGILLERVPPSSGLEVSRPVLRTPYRTVLRTGTVPEARSRIETPPAQSCLTRLTRLTCQTCQTCQTSEGPAGGYSAALPGA
jgi:hypothetical protein